MGGEGKGGGEAEPHLPQSPEKTSLNHVPLSDSAPADQLFQQRLLQLVG